MREIIELSKAEALSEDGQRVAGELEQLVDDYGGLVGYLSWLAEHHPNAYASLLGRVIPLQVRMDSHKDIQYRTMADVQRDIEELSKPLRRIAPMLLKMTIDHNDTKPQPVDVQEDREDGHFDDAEVESGS